MLQSAGIHRLRCTGQIQGEKIKLRAFLAVLALGCMVSASTARAQGKVEVLWLGQAAFRITSPGGKVIVIDPFLIHNAKTPPQYKNLDALGKVDLVLLPIGGNFTMDDADAAFATREYLKPKFAIPMHYGSHPLHTGTPQKYIQALGNAPVKVFPLNPGEKAEF